MDKVSGQKNAYAYLYPQIVPNDHFLFPVSDGHQIYVEEVGNPTGIPVVVLHGGPGGGCSPFMRRFFDPDVYRVILFDQRGCGRSLPASSVENNTTWHLINDIERIREPISVLRTGLYLVGAGGLHLVLPMPKRTPNVCVILFCGVSFWARSPSWIGSMVVVRHGSGQTSGMTSCHCCQLVNVPTPLPLITDACFLVT